ncbi:transmembrane protein, putative [Medicago truncatula]|uniref:Transmembrane protein, putative n=1 Tax=Medicago truncatula TaxID=3880 RepID=A0A072UIV9_MEDTR|nr:transmembrane protein, putative [Medicago truncatula]
MGCLWDCRLLSVVSSMWAAVLCFSLLPLVFFYSFGRVCCCRTLIYVREHFFFGLGMVVGIIVGMEDQQVVSRAILFDCGLTIERVNVTSKHPKGEYNRASAFGGENFDGDIKSVSMEV